MNPLRRAVRRATAVIFPWPAKHEREASIAAARQQKERSRAAAQKAGVMERQIQTMAAGNHWAATIASHILEGGGR